MPEFETYTCVNCGTEFRTHPSANPVATEACSPSCRADIMVQ
jgi:DNA-directed RNA polymerase subunit RPC12/RpoP